MLTLFCRRKDNAKSKRTPRKVFLPLFPSLFFPPLLHLLLLPSLPSLLYLLFNPNIYFSSTNSFALFTYSNLTRGVPFHVFLSLSFSPPSLVISFRPSFPLLSSSTSYSSHLLTPLLPSLSPFVLSYLLFLSFFLLPLTPSSSPFPFLNDF